MQGSKLPCLAGLVCVWRFVAAPVVAGVVEDANEAMTRAFQAEAPTPVLAANLAILHLAKHDAMRVGFPKVRCQVRQVRSGL